MNPTTQKPHLTCDGQCDQCAPSTSGAEGGASPGPTGGRLVMLSVVVFLLPLLTAAAGAAAAQNRGIQQVAGAALGLLAGILIACMMYRFFMEKNDVKR